MASRPRIYIDSCYYIDVVRGRFATPLVPGRESHLPFVENLLLAAENRDVEIWASTLIISECLSVAKNDLAVPEDVQRIFMSLLSSGSVVNLAAVDFFIAERARDLRWVDGIKCGGGADMVHVATALELHCEEFITTNMKRGPLQGEAPAKLAALGLRVITAPQTSVLPPKYIQPLFTSEPSS